MNVTAITDGACSGNPGPGGWAYRLECGNHTVTRSGEIAQTTNNAAELIAVREAVRAIKKPCTLKVVTDSSLVVGLLSQGWKRKVMFLRFLCRQIEKEAAAKGVVLLFDWTKGHADNDEHNRIDALARKEARSGWKKTQPHRELQPCR